MSALQLEDLLPHLGELTPLVAQRWVAAALAQAAALREHDGWLYPASPAKQEAAQRLHEAWRRWADDAEVLLRRAAVLPLAGRDVAGLDELRDAVGRTQAMLQLSPAVIAKRREQVRRGEVYSVEEVRREVQSSLRR